MSGSRNTIAHDAEKPAYKKKLQKKKEQLKLPRHNRTPRNQPKIIKIIFGVRNSLLFNS